MVAIVSTSCPSTCKSFSSGDRLREQPRSQTIPIVDPQDRQQRLVAEEVFPGNIGGLGRRHHAGHRGEQKKKCRMESPSKSMLATAHIIHLAYVNEGHFE